LRNEKLHLQNFSLNIIQLIKSRRKIWASICFWQVWEKENVAIQGVGGGKMNERDKLKEVRVDEK